MARSPKKPRPPGPPEKPRAASTAPLSDKMRRVLLAILLLREDGKDPPTPNEIGQRCGYESGMARIGNSGRGNSTRVMGLAVHVTTALVNLRERGLVYSCRRRDGMSGSAYDLTDEGEHAAKAARAEGLDVDAAKAEGQAPDWRH